MAVRRGTSTQSGRRPDAAHTSSLENRARTCRMIGWVGWATLRMRAMRGDAARQLPRKPLEERTRSVELNPRWLREAGDGYVLIERLCSKLW